MKACYPIILSSLETEQGYLVYVPDFDTNTSGKDLTDALYMARDAICICGISYEDDNEPIPSPSDLNAVQCKDNEIKTLVDVDFEAYRKANDERSIRKNCTIPAWLNDKAEKAGINFSAALQDALKQRLQIQ